MYLLVMGAEKGLLTHAVEVSKYQPPKNSKAITEGIEKYCMPINIISQGNELSYDKVLCYGNFIKCVNKANDSFCWSVLCNHSNF